MNDMNEWLRQTFPVGGSDTPITLESLLFRLALALVLGVVVAIIYRLTHRAESPAAPSFVATLVLLCILLAVVTQVIGNSAARAFSLVGILSIVRFRTVVEDTRDTAFVIFAVVVGMASGVGNMMVALVGLGVVGTAALVLYWVQGFTFKTQLEWTLHLRISTGAGGETPWESLFAQQCLQAELVSTGTARQGAAIDLVYKLKLKPAVTPLQFLHGINRLEGIQNLELKRS